MRANVNGEIEFVLEQSAEIQCLFENFDRSGCWDQLEEKVKAVYFNENLRRIFPTKFTENNEHISK